MKLSKNTEAALGVVIFLGILTLSYLFQKEAIAIVLSVATAKFIINNR